MEALFKLPKKAQILGMDIGGSLAKLAYYVPSSVRKTLPQQTESLLTESALKVRLDDEGGEEIMLRKF